MSAAISFSGLTATKIRSHGHQKSGLVATRIPVSRPSDLEADSQPRLEAWAHRELGLALSKRNKAEAEKHFNKALELYEFQGVHLEVARTHMMVAKLLVSKDVKGQLRAYERATTAIDEVQEV